MKKIEVTNPFDQSLVGTVEIMDDRAVELSLAKAFSLSTKMRHGLSKHLRISILKKTAEIMRSQASKLALLIAEEGGKPLQDAIVEVDRAIDGVETCVSEIGSLTGNEVAMGLTEASSNKIAFTTKEPIGVVLAISAFNHPLNLIVHQVAPAVATGCPVLVKPADDTPLSCRKFVEILLEAGLPEGWAQFVYCSIENAERLVKDERVAFLSFIGSARVGWKLRSLVAPGTRVALEHGGVAPVLVGSTARMKKTVPKIVKGGFYHAGQVCVSVQRVFALGLAARDLAEQIGELAQELVVGNAINEGTECGPLIRHREVDRVESWVNEAISSGGTLISGGNRLGLSTFSPTVILDPDPNCQISTKEIFGPVVCVFSCNSLDEVITRANNLPFAFQASVFSNDFEEIMTACNELDASAVMVNEHTAFRVDWMPFSGRRQSGYGTGGIRYTMEDMSNDKMRVLSYS